MKELKTLNDIEMSTATRYRIKAEAIKWVKYYDNIFDSDPDPAFVTRLLKMFFNITEEDLK